MQQTVNKSYASNAQQIKNDFDFTITYGTQRANLNISKTKVNDEGHNKIYKKRVILRYKVNNK